MNALIDREIGEDIGQMLPQVDEVGWAVDRFDIRPESDIGTKLGTIRQGP